MLAVLTGYIYHPEGKFVIKRQCRLPTVLESELLLEEEGKK